MSPLNKSLIASLKNRRTSGKDGGEKGEGIRKPHFEKLARAAKDRNDSGAAIVPYSDSYQFLSTTSSNIKRIMSHFESLKEDEYHKAWEYAETIEKSGAWLKGYLAMGLSRDYGDGAIKRFAEERKMNTSHVYDYMKLVQIFPEVDEFLEPSFHIRAIRISHGDKKQAIKLIDEARSRKKVNPKYTVSNFVAEFSIKKDTKEIKVKSKTAALVDSITKMAESLKESKDAADFKKDIANIIKVLQKI